MAPKIGEVVVWKPYQSGGYCEFCYETPCRNSQFYQNQLCSDSFGVFLSNKESEYEENLDLDSRESIASPSRYAKEIRFQCYKLYAQVLGLPWGKSIQEDLPHCFVGMIRLLFLAPGKNLQVCKKEINYYFLTLNRELVLKVNKLSSDFGSDDNGKKELPVRLFLMFKSRDQLVPVLLLTFANIIYRKLYY